MADSFCLICSIQKQHPISGQLHLGFRSAVRWLLQVVLKARNATLATCRRHPSGMRNTLRGRRTILLPLSRTHITVPEYFSGRLCFKEISNEVKLRARDCWILAQMCGIARPTKFQTRRESGTAQNVTAPSPAGFQCLQSSTCSGMDRHIATSPPVNWW